MISLNLYSQNDVKNYIQTRVGESKFGEKIQFVSSISELHNATAKYVLLGIPEDVGIRANRGKSGAAKTWNVFLNAFLNIQTNRYNRPEQLVLLGEVDCRAWMQKADSISKSDDAYYEKLGEIVTQIDKAVEEIVEAIVLAGKIPIVIGGGHNNSYGIIKACSKALQTPINVANIDAHTDLRPMEFRHSGNGFTYALAENYLDRYSIFGLHKNYTPESIFELMDANKKIKYHLFEDCLHLTSLDKLVKMKTSLDFLKGQFGMELDCDVIHNINASAVTPSGFSLNVMRSFMKLIRKHKIHYLHICEAAPNEHTLIGKTLSYLVSDFIREDG
ncbi:formimidoylglutamase [Psychroflexus salis]|uniref:Arginase n=1 Tax=Psychroflexus salis TaxID=1526574 RepID=A0A916ZXR4_9FLAO|nr:formimidoylglutamase [Psychroflexus salis]GGE17154.1 arginase [Psychroflexus salis]